MLRPFLIALSTTALSATAQAEVPRVVTDIAPVHGLVSMVMQDLGEPSLLIEPGSSPHTNAMRPSAAAALQDADIVFWVGEDLTPWLADPIITLAIDADHIPLLDLDMTQRREFRELESFGADGDHDHGDDHDHSHDHEHAATDPHAWLDPQNGQSWLTAIADTLAAQDPENAATYRANAATGIRQIADAKSAAELLLAPLKDRPFIVFHDAYQYFETGFDLQAAGALSLSDAVPPSPSHVADIQNEIRKDAVVCVFSEPQYSDGLVKTVIDGTSVKTAQLDPLGTALDPGANLYPDLIRDMARRFQDCLQ